MTTPTPSDFARAQTQRKQQEQQHEKEIAELKKKLAKSSSEKHEKTVVKNRSRGLKGTGRPMSSSTKHDSSVSRSSQKAKVPAESSTPRSPRKVAVKGTSSKSEQIAQSSDQMTSSTKRLTPQKKQDNGTEAVKKPFVRKPHLTQRLSDNEALLELQKSFPKTQHRNRSEKRTSSSSKRK